MTEFRCDVTQEGTPLPHSWSRVVGSGHALLALRRDWLAQLRRCHDELGVEYVRFHGIFDDDVGTLTVQDEQTIYSFYNAFQIYDGILSAGMRPFVELSFMPRALASGDTTVFSYAGNVTPPEDPEAWTELVRRFVSALVERYGIEELRRWYFEGWNEPNLDAFWTGTQDDYFDLYRRTAETVKEVDDALRVGGPATANNEWIEEFVGFCRETGTPVDFISTHQYPTDAFGKPGDDTEKQLAEGRRNIMSERVQNTVRKAAGLPVFYTEWNTSSNPFFRRHDDPYAAAFVAKTCLDVAKDVAGYSYWTFSDIFEENYFSSVPFHGGFGLLTIHGVAKPTYRAFQLMHALGDERLLVDGIHPTIDCYATRGDGKLVVLLTNHALPTHAISGESVRLRLTGATASGAASVERIDDDHANPRQEWERMGEPEYPSAEQLERLHAASEVKREALQTERDGHDVVLTLELPPHAVASIALEGIA